MSTIVITYDGNPIPDVVFASASFESQLGAVPGAFSFTVRDKLQEYWFETGKEITLEIDGTRYFGGYVMQVIETIAFPVDDTSGGASTVQTRQWILRGVDYNILFDKRVVYNVAEPTHALDTFLTTATDKEVLTKLFEDYLDIADDGIDTDTFVDVVGDPTPTGAKGLYVNPGDTWRKQMEIISLFTGAIWYIDANKKLHYQALETAMSAWGFSDVPDQVATFGFRELEFTEDATNLVNDALVWGGSEFGSTGVSAEAVFGRSQNEDSIAAHGRWQFPERHFDEVQFFEDTGCIVRSKVIVFGDPGGDSSGDQSRGLQNPQKNIRLTWFGYKVPSPLVAGTVVTVELNVFGMEPLPLPVRVITITFPTPYEPRFEGFLGIQTSDPWSLWKYLKVVSASTRSTRPVITSDGSAPADQAGTFVSTTPTPDPDGSTVVFTVPDPYIFGSTQLYRFPVGEVGGLFQRAGYEYTESDPANGEITFLTPPLDSDTLWIRYYSV